MNAMACAANEPLAHAMKEKKTRLLAALSSLLASRPAAMAAERCVLAEIEAAVARCADGDEHVHEILFLVSNAPGAITFLARRISKRVEAAREAAAAVRALTLVHRLLRGGDRYFEQDLRGTWAGGELRVGVPGGGGFIAAYSAFLEERLGWVINQAGSLEPVRERGTKESAAGWELNRLRKSQVFLDRAMDCEPSEASGSSRGVRSAFGIVVRESIRVYETFSDAAEAIVRSYSDLEKSMKGLAVEALHKASTQTPRLRDFFENCKIGGIDGKNLDYPFVRIITAAEVASIGHSASCSDDEDHKLFWRKMQTTISTVWVEFHEEGSRPSFFSLGASDDNSWRGKG